MSWSSRETRGPYKYTDQDVWSGSAGTSNACPIIIIVLSSLSLLVSHRIGVSHPPVLVIAFASACLQTRRVLGERDSTLSSSGSLQRLFLAIHSQAFISTRTHTLTGKEIREDRENRREERETGIHSKDWTRGGNVRVDDGIVCSSQTHRETRIHRRRRLSVIREIIIICATHSLTPATQSSVTLSTRDLFSHTHVCCLSATFASECVMFVRE